MIIDRRRFLAISTGALTMVPTDTCASSLEIEAASYLSVGLRVSPVKLSSNYIDEDAARGALIGTLSGPNVDGWTFSLPDTAGDMFALEGLNIVVGVTVLSHDTLPTPTVVIRASRDGKVFDTPIVIKVRRPLPALPLATGARIVAVGDSQIGYNNYGGEIENSATLANRAVATLAYGFIEQALSVDPRFNFDSWMDPNDISLRNISGANQGVHADHLNWMNAKFPGGGIINRLPDILAKRPDLLILEGGGNSINSGDSRNNVPATPDYCIAQLDRGLVLCRNEGVPVILMTMYPGIGWVSSDRRWQTFAAVNNWIRAQADRNGVVGILDSQETLAPGGIVDKSLYFSDGIHLNHRGAYKIGTEHFLPIIQRVVTDGFVFDVDPTVSNLWGTNAKLTGTTGAKNNPSNITGPIANPLRIGVANNTATVVCSKEVFGASEVEKQVLDISFNDALPPTTLSGAVTVEFPAISGPMLPVVGQWVQVAWFTEVDDNNVLSFVFGEFHLMNGWVKQAGSRVMNGYSSDFAIPMIGNRGWWSRSKPMQIPSNIFYDRLRLIVALFFKRGPTFRAKISRPIMRVVPDPRVVWNYPTD